MRQITLHKEWMIRSYVVVTFGFVFFRLRSNWPVSLGIGTRPEIVSAVSWLCWALPLLVVEVVLATRKIMQARPPRQGTVAPASIAAAGSIRRY
jgi:hypothetical protein